MIVGLYINPLSWDLPTHQFIELFFVISESRCYVIQYYNNRAYIYCSQNVYTI